MEDVVQETFLKVFQSLDSFDPSRAFGPWVGTIARRTALNRLRKRRRQSHLRTMEEERSTEDPWSILGARAKVRVLEKALLSLDDASREVVLLVEVEGVTLREVAEERGESINTIASRLRRARLKLIAFFDERENTPQESS